MYDPRQVSDYYDRYGAREWERLAAGRGLVELEVVLHLLRRHLPASGHILDAGGGPGRYAIRLAEMGYRVTLADISAAQLARAVGAFPRSRLS